MNVEVKPLKIIYCTAPVRICDLGGWTDTWFAERGVVFNIGVSPHAEVQVDVYRRSDREHQVMLFAENFADRYVVTPGKGEWDKHPLLEATIEMIGIPDNIAVEITLYSDVPAGASIGTSAAVTVALVGALDLLTPGQMTAHEIAYAAQSVEVDMLGRQSGIQDQLAAAYGNINFIEMFNYPHASVSQIKVPDRIWWELNRRLVLVYLGTSHDSSQVHEEVIAALEGSGPDTPALVALRSTPRQARDSVLLGDFRKFGQVMIANNQMQRDLHPALISADADHVIAIAREYNALGWKVNGAGGNGGSITLLCGDSTAEQRRMISAIEAANPLFRHIPIHLTRNGVFAWEVERG